MRKSHISEIHLEMKMMSKQKFSSFKLRRHTCTTFTIPHYVCSVEGLFIASIYEFGEHFIYYTLVLRASANLVAC